jgi:hypothetical protein
VKPDVLIPILAVVISIFGVVVSIIALVRNKHTANAQQELTRENARRQEELTRENVRRQELGVAQWRHDLRDWAFEAIDVLSEAIYECEAKPEASPSDFRKYLYRLWALIDRGRLFLPNQHPEDREDPVLAFKGFRHKALDPLWAAGDVLEDRIDPDLRPDVVRLRRYVLGELQREFVSNISLILSPEEHNKAIARLIKESERDISDAAKQQIEALVSKGIPPGDKSLLHIVVPRVREYREGK